MRWNYNKKIRLFFCIATIVVSYQFYRAVPERVTLIEGRESTLPHFLSQEDSKLTLLGIPYKSVQVDVIPGEALLIGGQSIGVEMNVDGVQILGFSEVRNPEGKKCCPAQEHGLREGDVIQHVNGEKITNTAHLITLVSSGTELNLSYRRDGQLYHVAITPVKSSEDGQYRLGLWARDGTTGIGTLTFVSPSQKKFGALGHSITDADTNQPIIVSNGAIYPARITGVTKGTKGTAGELRGNFLATPVGEITKNVDFGIFGSYAGTTDAAKPIPIASRNEIRTGPAQIYCCVSGTEVRAYDVLIEWVDLHSYDNKGMILRVTDGALIRKTGGIVQGMSGSPIIQNGKLVGAVTHVFVNDPTRGYGIFIENMYAMCTAGS